MSYIPSDSIITIICDFEILGNGRMEFRRQICTSNRAHLLELLKRAIAILKGAGKEAGEG
jgi:hypothetical protein